MSYKLDLKFMILPVFFNTVFIFLHPIIATLFLSVRSLEWFVLTQLWHLSDCCSALRKYSSSSWRTLNCFLLSRTSFQGLPGWWWDLWSCCQLRQHLPPTPEPLRVISQNFGLHLLCLEPFHSNTCHTWCQHLLHSSWKDSTRVLWWSQSSQCLVALFMYAVLLLLFRSAVVVSQPGRR